MSQEQTKDILAEWRESAPYWEKHAVTIREMFAPITRALIEQARISDGMSVLDVAGGIGDPSLAIADVVGATGSVICTDGVLEMVKTAMRESRARDRARLEVCQCLADSLPFADGSFDVAVSRLGAMFFPSTLAALSEMLRVVVPGGNVSLAVWGDKEFNPFFRIVTDVMSGYIESPTDDANAPGAFRFAEEGVLARLLAEAGAVRIKEFCLSFRIQAMLSPSEFWHLRSEMSDTLRHKLSLLTAERIAHVAAEVDEAAREFFPHNRMNFPGRVLIVTGSRPL
jgi:SAM-dependent methyltransferase